MQHVVSVLDRMVERQEKLDDVMQALAESHIKTQEQLQENARQLQQTDRHLQETDRHLRETDRHLQETDRHLRETDERLRRATLELDARIDKLVSGIGEFIRQQSGSKPS